MSGLIFLVRRTQQTAHLLEPWRNGLKREGPRIGKAPTAPAEFQVNIMHAFGGRGHRCPELLKIEPLSGARNIHRANQRAAFRSGPQFNLPTLIQRRSFNPEISGTCAEVEILANYPRFIVDPSDLIVFGSDFARIIRGTFRVKIPGKQVRVELEARTIDL